jgi:hypothetical protein
VLSHFLGHERHLLGLVRKGNLVLGKTAAVNEKIILAKISSSQENYLMNGPGSHFSEVHKGRASQFGKTSFEGIYETRDYYRGS